MIGRDNNKNNNLANQLATKQSQPYLTSLFRSITLSALLVGTSTSVLANERIHLVTEHLPPFQILTKDAIDGYATEIVTSALIDKNIAFTIDAYPWPRAYSMAKTEPNTCIFSIARTPEREEKFKWVGTIAETYSDFVGLKSNNNIQINSIADAKNYNIAVIRDDVSHEILLKNGFVELENLYVINNTFSLLKLLTYRKDIDLILVDQLTIDYRAKYSKIDPQLFRSFYRMNKKPYYFYLACSNQTSDDTVNKISEALADFKKTKRFKEIDKKWRR